MAPRRPKAQTVAEIDVVIIEPKPPEIPFEERLQNFGVAIAKLRDEAVKGRKESGIEDEWMACEEAYIGCDDENRSDFARARWAKPQDMSGPLIYRNSSDGVRSTAFVRLTSRYVDAAAAKIGEITQTVDDNHFALDPTPVPQLIADKENDSPVIENGKPVMRPARPEELPQQPAAPGMLPPNPEAQPADPNAPQVPVKVKDLATELMDKASAAAKKAKKRIDDWLIECNYSAERRNITFDAARCGVGVIKGPFPFQQRNMAWREKRLQFDTKLIPAAKWVDFWNLFPDPACGENIHDGDFLFERDFLTRGKLHGLKKLKGRSGRPIYIASQIDKVLAEGPGKCLTEGRNPSERDEKKRFEIWYAFAAVSLADLGLVNQPAVDDIMGGLGEGEKPPEEVFAIVTLVNDTVIRATINPLDSGSFPYHAVPWRRRAGHWAGVGVAEQVRLAQRITNASTRALLNNGGLSGGLQIVVDRDSIEPADGDWTMTPNKFWWKTADADIQDMRAAFQAVEFPNVVDQMMKIIEYGFRLAEEASSVPLVTQGQSGDTTPDTFSGQQLQDNNANQLLRDVGFSFADKGTNPLIKQFYEWLLLDPDVPDDEKGDYQVNVSGAIALIERAIQEQTIVQLGAMVLNPAFGLDPKRWSQQFLRLKRLDPRDFSYSEEEQRRMESAPPPEDPVVTAAKIRADAQVKSAQDSNALMAKRIEVDTDRDTAYNQSLARRDEINARAKLEQLQVQERIADKHMQLEIIKLHSQKLVNDDDLKAMLAKVVMTLRTQVQLQQDQHDQDAKQVAPQGAEPAGRAPNGQAFTQ